MSIENNFGYREVRVLSANLLDDSYVHKHAPQNERLEDLAGLINLINPDVALFMEGASERNLYALSEMTGLVLPTKPYRSTVNELMAFAVKPSVEIESKPRVTRYGKFENGLSPGFLAMVAAGVRFIGIHNPHRMVLDVPARNDAADAVVDIINTPSLKPLVVMGDLNSQYFHYARRAFTQWGLIEVFKDNRPPYPVEGYRGKTVPYVFPTISVDGVYVSSDIEVISYGALSTLVTETGKQNKKLFPTDHPILHAQLGILDSVAKKELLLVR